MTQTSFRIYAAANLVVYLFFAIYFFPEGLLFGFFALFFSMLFSAPTLPLLLCLFYGLERWRINVIGSWVLLLLTVLLCAFVPEFLFNLSDDSLFGGDHSLLLLSLGSAFSGIVLQTRSIQNYFQSFQPAKEECPEAFLPDQSL